MSDRITKCFAKAKAEGRGAFVSYLTMGYPTLQQSEDAVDALVAGGVDIVELGVPFSDPFADGAVIRSAAYKALENGVTLDDVLAAAKRIRAKHPESKIVLLPIFPRGAKPDDKARVGNGKVNEIIRTYADGKGVIWLDFNDRFLLPDGTLPKAMFPDELHPNKDGYRIWADAVLPVFRKVVGR